MELQVFSIVSHEATSEGAAFKEEFPSGEVLDNIIMDYFGQPQEGADGSPPPKQSIFGQIQNTVTSLQRFAKQLSQ